MLTPILAIVLFTFAFAQQAPSRPTTETAPPPIRMGLWETTVTATYGGDMALPPHTSKFRSCATPEDWATAFQDRGNQGCERTNESLGPHHYSTDFSCQQGMTGHVNFDFPTSDAGHGTMHMEGSMNGHHMVADSVTETHFVSDSCGSVKPNHAVMVR